MREIKFRAWDKENKLVFQVESLSWCDPLFIVADPGLDHMDIQDRDFRTKRVPDDIELMQYTGLKDKNGKEIYEGDILRGNGGAEDFFFDIGFEHGCFIAKMPWIMKDKEKRIASYPELKYYIDMTFCWVEVIGNIYENPELLEGK